MDDDSFAVAYSFAELSEISSIRELSVCNCEKFVKNRIFRDEGSFFGHLNEFMRISNDKNGMSVCLVYNLGMEMYALAPFIASKKCRTLAKGHNAPISITVLDDDGDPSLVFLDAAGLFGKSICDISEECNYLVRGFFDYAANVTPATPLTIDEVEYLTSSTEVLLVYLAHIMRMYDWIGESRIGINIVTATGLVREWQRVFLKGQKSPFAAKSVGQYARYQAKKELPKDDDELYTYNMCTRGGLAFIGAEHASKPYDLRGTGKHVYAFDARSQYPAQILSHKYPERFRPMQKKELDMAFQMVCCRNLEYLLDHWESPFYVAFDGFFEFKNIRLKSGSVFEKDGIATLSWNRFNDRLMVDKDGTMEFTTMFTNMLHEQGYKDVAENAERAFGKLVSADVCRVWITEQEAWIMAQVYQWDSVEAVCGYGTTHFTKPTDLSVLSVMGLYDRKDKTQKSSDRYQYVKRDLNSLYGIEATNEARPATYIDEGGIHVSDTAGIDDVPENPKAWYQMGQRVGAWGRVAQVVNMMLVADHVDAILCGDTDSIKVIAKKSQYHDIERGLSLYGKAVEAATDVVCERVRANYPEIVHDVRGIGTYVLEYVANRFCAGWNKAYIYDAGEGIEIVISGMTTKGKGFDATYTDLANELDCRMTWQELCAVMLGYNVTIDKRIAKGVSVLYPIFGGVYDNIITDRDGRTVNVRSPMMPTIKPVGFTMNATYDEDILNDMCKAHVNNKLLDGESAYLTWEPGQPPHIGRMTDWGFRDEVL